MRTFQPGRLQSGSVGQLAQSVEAEMRAIKEAAERASSYTFAPTYAAPSKVEAGLTVLALSPWNPGSGDGVYTYYSGAWHKLG